MSWLSIPLPNPFKALQFDTSSQPPQSPPSPCSPSHGVKDDLSVLGQTISRQLRGVAAFLAPPPPTPSSSTSSEEAEGSSSSSSMTFLGIRDDLVEIGGSFNKAVTEISKFASNLLQIEQVMDGGGGGGRGAEKFEESDEELQSGLSEGISNGVLDFVNEISMRPECWTSFPLSLNHYDFNMSNAQKEHASSVLRLVPSFSSLRRKLCSHMSESQFWMIYFVMLFPRLKGRDLELLLTPQIVDARDAVLRRVQSKSKIQTPKEDGIQRKRTLLQDSKYTIDVCGATVDADIAEHKYINERLEEASVKTSTSAEPPKQLQIDESCGNQEDAADDLTSRSNILRTQIWATSPSDSEDWVQLKGRFDRKGSQQKVNPLNYYHEKDSDDSSNDWLTIDGFDSDGSRPHE